LAENAVILLIEFDCPFAFDFGIFFE